MYKSSFFHRVICTHLCQEEDEEELKWELLAWAMGDTWKKNTKAFLIAKDNIWKKMDFRCDTSQIFP